MCAASPHVDTQPHAPVGSGVMTDPDRPEDPDDEEDGLPRLWTLAERVAQGLTEVPMDCEALLRDARELATGLEGYCEAQNSTHNERRNQS